jgi:hypothetical protein
LELATRGIASKFESTSICSRHYTNEIQVYEDPEPTADERVEELERENDFLRSKLATLERQLNTQSSPTRKPNPSRATAIRDSDFDIDHSILSSESSDLENMFQRVNAFKVAETYNSPSKPKAVTTSASAKKPRRVTARKRDLGPEEDL